VPKILVLTLRFAERFGAIETVVEIQVQMMGLKG
jgi:hypothetical protein